MAIADFRDVKLPYDPIIDVIFRDASGNAVFKKSLQGIPHPIIPYRCTLHPSDQLLDAWYRFKENRPLLVANNS